MYKNYAAATAGLALSFGLAGAVKAQGIQNLPDLIDTVIPAVVKVTCIAGASAAPSPLSFEDLLKRKPDLSPGSPTDKPPAEPPQRKGTGTGTGVVLNNGKGYILTNEHVVSKCDEVKVSLHGNERRFLSATIVGKDTQTDIAVLKIKENAAGSQATLGDSNRLRLGENVFAIGHPFGFYETVTTGIVSGKKRGADGPYDDLIQTDTAVNPGNSGGPLFNSQGQVVAINSAIFSTTGQYAGISLAIPINQAKWVADKLIEKGNVPWGYLGASISHVSEEQAAKVNRTDLKGVWINAVAKDAPAAGAIQGGDVVLRVNGAEVNTPQELARSIAETLSGNSARLDVWRNGKIVTKNVTLGARPNEDLVIKTLKPW